MASFLVGTFNTPELFQLHFDSTQHALHLVETFAAHGNHSWLALNEDRSNLYATAWTEPAGVASYRLQGQTSANGGLSLELLNTAATRARSGYVAVGKRCANVLYSVGGPTGEVMRVQPDDGSFPPDAAPLQHLDFVHGYVSTPEQDAAAVTHTNSNGRGQSNGRVMDFGGLRHGSHSIDLSHDGSLAYVADIGRNCVWVYTVSAKDGSLTLAQKSKAVRRNDGPRHVWPHPNGRVVYVLQEHSCMVDVFEVRRYAEEVAQGIEANGELGPQSKQVDLCWRQGVRIIPTELQPSLFWADEVRTSPGETPTHLLASTRGLEADTKGYVALFALDEQGYVSGLSRTEAVKEEGEVSWLHLWQSPTSGGWANAVEPCYKMLAGPDGRKSTYAVLTDSEQGLVMVLQVIDDRLVEVARVKLGKMQGKVRGAATAVWL